MIKKKKETLVNRILFFLEETYEYLPAPFETPYTWIRRAGSPGSYKNYYNTVRHLHKHGLAKTSAKKGKRFIQLTEKGHLKILMSKAVESKKMEWDGRWRILSFDIPETSRSERDVLRRWLKSNNFIKLQNSVYIGPYQIKKEAVQYLKGSGLIDYIRIFRVDLMDDEEELLTKFKLKRATDETQKFRV
jgi:DNA-binding transcriptional regulator PaaX